MIIPLHAFYFSLDVNVNPFLKKGEGHKKMEEKWIY